MESFISNMPCGHLFISPIFLTKYLFPKNSRAPPLQYSNGGPLRWRVCPKSGRVPRASPPIFLYFASRIICRSIRLHSVSEWVAGFKPPRHLRPSTPKKPASNVFSPPDSSPLTNSNGVRETCSTLGLHRSGYIQCYMLCFASSTLS